MGALKIDDIAPDGVHIVVDWSVVRAGSSFFVPCINTSAAKKQVKAVFERRGWKMRCAIRPENKLWGIRIWRIA